MEYVEYETLPQWAVLTIAGGMLMICLIVTLIYIPRVEEIERYKNVIAHQRKIIDIIAKNATDAALEHIADIGEIGEKLLAAEGKQDQIAEEYSEKLADAQARTEQSEDLRRQIARAADKLREGAQA